MAFVQIGGISTSRSSAVAKCSAKVIRGRSVAPMRMCAENSTVEEKKETSVSAEETRRILNEGESMVKFGNNVPQYVAQESAYQAGSTGVDIWLITGFLVFLVPIAITVWGVQQGWIDLSPR